MSTTTTTTTTIYSHQELLALLESAGSVAPAFKVDIEQLNKEMKSSKHRKNRKKSHSASESRRYSSYKRDRAALNHTISELGSDHDEAAVESNDESGDSSSEIDAKELSSRYYLQRSSAPRRNQKDINPKFATAVANSLATADGKTHHPYRAPGRRQSSSQDSNAFLSASPKEEDGWISVGPKNHGHGHGGHGGYGHRKSFNHEEGAGHRKRFSDYNRASRGSFSKQQPVGSAATSAPRKKSFAKSEDEGSNAATAAISDAATTDGEAKLETYDLSASEATAREYEAWKAKLNEEKSSESSIAV
ncbi:uncharacterized protein SAPINGB_P000324 [Magnusiomyces paraingens]|uniref:Uncharacterized protein n=1 Tax=Magnusiomyces paraingens TaxID=2606893 RepID=A0A5E8AYE3_9ASCO|nr:uncharacterized protein SAPINGB_P000324 [Saprochaete ingens]VVT44161.1 unnamed protein product [Saprochaete ingens]